ncbi:MAG TPA: sigma-54 dependent transcriptional regulator [Acidobacteriaceae bacterium]|nr:sigma-54 dependent transcriptional regulator [Acidobacteriaceae bacterium]
MTVTAGNEWAALGSALAHAGAEGATAARMVRGGMAELRSVVVVSADPGLRQRLSSSLESSRWQVREARGGAEAMMHLDAQRCEAILIDSWLPDLEAAEFASHVRLLYPAMDVLGLDGGGDSMATLAGDAGQVAVKREETGRSPRRNELLHAIRTAREQRREVTDPGSTRSPETRRPASATSGSARLPYRPPTVERHGGARAASGGRGDRMPELVGRSEAIREVVRLVEMVAPRMTPVLIEGETGTGKELVARALHRLSGRAAKPFVVLNCAAIPEALLEAELFGHARGAFTGAVQSRMGRIESANGGTLLLDEIGEMPLGMQAKMLRFLESGELQKVGENETMRVDVRLVAATHQPLERRSAEGTFRLDLYHRLAVFPIEIPALRERMEDVEELAEHFLEQMGRQGPRKRLSMEAVAWLEDQVWPGNVRELMHVLERGAILAGERPEIGVAEVGYRRLRMEDRIRGSVRGR